MQLLQPESPEPELGSIVLDFNGICWQRRKLGGQDAFFEPGHREGIGWMTLQALGPLSLVAIVLGGNTAERWPPLNDDGFLPGDVDLIGDNPWS